MSESCEPVPEAATDNVAAAEALTRLLLLARAEFGVEVRSDETPETAVNRVLALARRLVPGAEHIGLSWSGAAETAELVGPADPLVEACEQAQADTGEGPSVEIGGGTAIVHCRDLTEETRWPAFTARAVAQGVRSLLACELPVGARRRGALLMCAARPAAFDEVAELIVPVLASRVSVALAYADKLEHLRRAIDTRQVIGQACGILMERHRITADQAFAQLVTVSQRHHVKLRELATRVVESGQDPDAAAAE